MIFTISRKVTEQCNQMEPPIRAVFTFAEYEGIPICSAEIPAIDLSERPCYYKGAGKVKGSYVRVGDADMPMTYYEIYGYESYRKHVHDDERPIMRASMELLNRDQIDDYMSILNAGFSWTASAHIILQSAMWQLQASGSVNW